MSKTKTQTDASAPKRRRADAERSIAAIIDAALEALASDPDASMAEIARRAGVVRATIYMHFPTRESLLDAVMEHATGLGRRGDPGSRARPRRAEGSAGASASRDVAATQPVPQRPADQHQPALGEGTAPPTPPDDHAIHSSRSNEAKPKASSEAMSPLTWLIAVVRAIVHAASTELQAGRLSQAEVERTMLTTALAAVSSPEPVRRRQ